MRKLLSIVVAILFVGTALLLIRQNARDALNQSAIERLGSERGRSRPGSSAEQDTRHGQRVRESPAGARHRALEQ